MKTMITILTAMALITLAGCQATTGSRGGGLAQDEGFKISVPNFETVRQGELKNVTVSLVRGPFFKQDVMLEFKTTEGITIEPTSVMVDASDKAEVELRVRTSRVAALGEYRVYVKGTPAKGEPTSADFNVRVIAQ